ncbi:hypothetical protein [Candidatus Laterigemmans baculatus]|uniref:hypothetical protein n=1 Tax=Candidatus Laterigemmans baculatus TaxID=2770505 RepID=UPI0013DA15B0|nr:hypothetical protein [Candidatus Laterigemmans baculatus]
MNYLFTKGIFLLPIFILASRTGEYQMLWLSITIFATLIIFHKEHRNGRTPRHYMLLRLILVCLVPLMLLLGLFHFLVDPIFLDAFLLAVAVPFLGCPVVLGFGWLAHIVSRPFMLATLDGDPDYLAWLRDAEADGYSIYWDDIVSPFLTSDSNAVKYMTKSRREHYPKFEVDLTPDTSGPYGGRPVVCNNCGSNNPVDDRPCFRCGQLLISPEPERVDWRSQGDFWDNDIAAERRRSDRLG